MAPSSRSRISHGQARPINAFRVTKGAKLNVQPQATKQKLQAIEEIVCPIEPQQIQQNNKKRRRHAIDSDCENEEVTTRPQKAVKKARPATSTAKQVSLDRTRQTTLQLQTTPPSSPESKSLPAAFEELVVLHKSFTQALAVHYAHNGPRNAISLSELLPAMTRLWKRRTVSQQDIERILAVWEILPGAQETKTEVDHRNGPFRLLTTGIGSNSQVKIEYTWTESGSLVENELHPKFEVLVERLHLSSKCTPGSFAYDTLSSFPRLRCQTGTQTQLRKEKIGSIRDSILSKPTQTSSTTSSQFLDLSKLDISDTSAPKPTPRETALKSRTLSLFDRLRAKQLANSTSAAPTSAELLRRRALHRMPDIVDVLRLKQARKLSSQFGADTYGCPSTLSATQMKVSFSLEALVQEIRDSGKTNIAADEITECISILGREVPDHWCNVYSSGDVSCVTLQGSGWRKEEIKTWCEKEISRIGGC